MYPPFSKSCITCKLAELFFSLSLLERLHILGDVQDRGRKQHNENAWEYEQNKGKEYFDFCLRGHLLRPLLSFQADLVTKPTEGSDNRGTEPFSLHQHANKQRELRDLGTLCSALPSLQPWLAGQLPQIDLHELVV